jgi:shikimate dehydrogenase
MKLGLLGSQIQHSLSPSLYKEFLGDRLSSYQLFDIPLPHLIPSLPDFARDLNGLSITTPYKSHFLPEVVIKDPEIKKLGAINCISFSDKFMATNTDYQALKELIPETIATYPSHKIILLGDGAMARISRMIFDQLKISYHSFTRKKDGPLEEIDFKDQFQESLLVINACSREFIFRGTSPAHSVFWDYNYSFRSHSETLTSLFHQYIDGEELLRRQALSAITFWRETNPKLKC